MLQYSFSCSASIATRLFSTVSGDVKRGMKYLEPFIKERLEQEARYGKDWSEKPVRVFYSFYPLDVADWSDERMTFLVGSLKLRRETNEVSGT